MATNHGELHALEAKMSDLVDRRNSVIAAAEQMIDTANAEFDEIAVPLGREISRVRTALVQTPTVKKPARERTAVRTALVQTPTVKKPARERTARRRKTPELAGLTGAEREYFQQMVNGGKA